MSVLNGCLVWLSYWSFRDSHTVHYRPSLMMIDHHVRRAESPYGLNGVCNGPEVPNEPSVFRGRTERYLA